MLHDLIGKKATMDCRQNVWITITAV